MWTVNLFYRYWQVPPTAMLDQKAAILNFVRRPSITGLVQGRQQRSEDLLGIFGNKEYGHLFQGNKGYCWITWRGNWYLYSYRELTIDGNNFMGELNLLIGNKGGSVKFIRGNTFNTSLRGPQMSFCYVSWKAVEDGSDNQALLLDDMLVHACSGQILPYWEKFQKVRPITGTI